MVRTNYKSMMLVCAALAACGPEIKPATVEDQDPNPMPTADNRVTLSFVGDSKVGIAPLRSVTLKVLAKKNDGGAPVKDLEVTFKTSGTLQGSKIGSVAAKTASDGSAYVMVTAGSQDATFRLSATAPEATAASVDITVDGNAPANPTGTYDMATTVQPLSFMNQGTSLYATLYNILTAIAEPQNLPTDWKEFDAATMTTKTINKCSPPSDVWIVLCPLSSQFPNLIRSMLGLAGSTYEQVYNGIRSAGQALKEIRIGGSLFVKNYNSFTTEFDAQFVFDTYRFLWTADAECAVGGAQAGNPCCGHTLFDAESVNLQPFMRACAAPTSGTTTAGSCADVKGTITSSASSSTDFTIDVNEATLEIGYGSLVIGVLEGVVFPRSLPASFPRQGDGRVLLSDVAKGICGSSDPTCTFIAGVVGSVLNAFGQSLSTQGSSDWNAKFTISDAQLRDADNDGQPEQITGQLSLVGTASGSASATSAPFNALFARGTDKCTRDGMCASGEVCRFAPNPIDACFTRNVCSRPVGTRDGTASCAADLECKTGVCADVSNLASTDLQNKCVQVCGSQADCTGGGTCKTDARVAVDSYDGNGAQISVAGICVP